MVRAFWFAFFPTFSAFSDFFSGGTGPAQIWLECYWAPWQMFSTYHELLSCSENGGDWVLNNKSLWQIWEEKVAPMFPSRTFNKVVNVFYWSKRKWIWKFPMSSPCRLRYDLLAPKFFIASNSHWSDWKKSRPKLLRLGGLLRVKSGVFFFKGIGSASRHVEIFSLENESWGPFSCTFTLHSCPSSRWSYWRRGAKNPLVPPAHERHFPSNIWSSSLCGCFFLYRKRKLLAGCKTLVHRGCNNLFILWKEPYLTLLIY